MSNLHFTILIKTLDSWIANGTLLFCLGSNNLKNKEKDGSQNITSADETRIEEELGGSSYGLALANLPT